MFNLRPLHGKNAINRYFRVRPICSVQYMSNRFVLYWPNGRGLGHTSRAAKLSLGLISQFQEPSIIGLTGAAKGLGILPPQMDVLKLPSFSSIDGRHGAKIIPTLPITIGELFHIRSRVVDAFISCYRPDVWFIDFHPQGKDGELISAILNSDSVKILGLRGVLKAPSVTNKEFFSKAISNFIDRHFSAIHAYVDPNIISLEDLYDIPPKLSRKISYTGYLSNVFLGGKKEARDHLGLDEDKTIVLINFGGGDPANPTWRLIMTALNNIKDEYDQAILVMGPSVSREIRMEMLGCKETNQKLWVSDWKKEFHIWMKSSNLFIGAGGYNTISEILGNEINALLTPNQYTEQEQQIHLQRLSNLNHIRVLSIEEDVSNLELQIRDALRSPCCIDTSTIMLNGILENARLAKDLI